MTSHQIWKQSNSPNQNLSQNVERIAYPSTAIPATLNAAQGGISSTAAAAKEMENLSVEQLQKMVELEEKTKVKVDSVTKTLEHQFLSTIQGDPSGWLKLPIDS